MEIEDQEPQIRAWVLYDSERALTAAREADRVPVRARGPLHGLPLAIKDNFDTTDFPTACGVDAWKGRRPVHDALCVQLARKAGAIVIGKTVTTEYALLHPGPTRNPRDVRYSPGGSSSGSAAAIATFMAGVSLGSQTNGSVLRPASYCGVYGFKPTFGLIPVSGLAMIQPRLDTVGLFARDLGGLSLVLKTIGVEDSQDLHNVRQSLNGLDAALARSTKRRWHVGFTRTPAWERATVYSRNLIENFVNRLASFVDIDELMLPPPFDCVHEVHMVLQDAGVAERLYSVYAKNPNIFSPQLQETIKRGHAIASDQLSQALTIQRQLINEMDNVLGDVDVAISLAATGEPPITQLYTGDPAMQTLWTFTGTPALSIPRFTGPSGLPIGLQVTSRRSHDIDVLAFAKFLEECGV